MASWFTKALDRVTWWDRGGEAQRRREEEERQRQQQQRSTPSQAPRQSSSNTLRVTNTPSSARVSVDGYEPEPKPEKPKNIFEDLNKNLNFNKPNNVRNPVIDAGKTRVTDRPQPGTIVQPKLRVENRPNTQKITLPKFSALTPEEQAKRILERDLNAGKSWEDIARENNFDYDAVKQYSEATRPNYGIKVERPNQSLFDRFVRDRFDANTQADMWRRQEGNAKPGAEQKDIVLKNPGNIVSRAPFVGTVTKMVNTGIAQLQQMPATAQGAWLTKMQSDVVKQMQEAQASGDGAAYLEAKYNYDRISDELKKVFGQQEQDYGRFEKNKGGLFNAGTLYDQEGARKGDAETAIKDVALPTAVAMLDAYTLGKGNMIAQGIKNNGFRATLTQPASTMFKSGIGRVPVAGRSDVAKLALGNYLSGDLDVRAQGGSTSQAIKGGLLNTTLGSIPDIVLPALGNLFKGRILPGLRRGRVNPADVISEADDASIAASAKALLEETKPKPIPVRAIEDIPITKVETPGQLINVRNLNTPKELIQDVSGGERFVTPDALVKNTVEDVRVNEAFDYNKVNSVTPKEAAKVDGITPKSPEAPYKLDITEVDAAQSKIIDDYAAQLRQMGEGNGVQMVPDGEGGYIRVTNNVRPKDFKGKRITKAMWRDEAERQLREGSADPGFQKAFTDAENPDVQSLLSKGEQAPVEDVSRPINVQQIESGKRIPVMDNTDVPVNTPETPGKVRVSTATAPANEKAAQVAAKTPVALPTETQEILANPKKFTKRQVAAARNQRKLARAYAKAQEDTAAAMERIDTASPARQSDEGFVPTGEFKKGKNGNIYEKSYKAEEMAQGIKETSQMSPGDVIQTARNNKVQNGVYTPRDIRNVEALIEARRVQRGTPEFVEMQKILKESGSDWGKIGAFRQSTKMRRSASANELISRFETKIYSLAEDPTKIDSKLFDKIDAAETAFVEARDKAMEAYNRFTENPTTANAKAYHAAQDLADRTDIEAKQSEYLVAKQALKGNKDIKQVRALQKLASDADLGKMDYVDSAMLSSTGTMFRNFVNSLPGAVEEGIFGKPAAKIASKLSGETVGGGFGRGTFKDLGTSIKGFTNKAKVMKRDSGSIFRHPIENMKTWSTLGNEAGDTVIDTTARQSMDNYYRQVLKEQGFSGKELADRLGVMTRMDPEDLLPTYQTIARIDAGLSGGNIAKRSKIELQIANGISDVLSAGKPTAATDAIAKALTRVTVGFPSAVARATGTGIKRLTGVGPLYDFAKAIRETDPTKKALLMKQSIKQAGAGATVIPGLFYTLGQAGLITGSYPSDPEERARWEREGISENSIKIGDAWYQYPAFLGAWSVPATFWGNMGRTDGDWSESAKDTAKGVLDVVPNDQLSKIKEWAEGRYDGNKLFPTMGANTVRALTPAGALLNQVAKAFDSTKNDTNSGTALENFVDKVASGIPGVNNAANIPDKLDDAGNPIKNPSVIETMTGASSAVQKQGEERTAQIQSEVDSAIKSIYDTGALQDGNFREILDDKTALIYDKAAKGEKLKEGELEDLQDALVKGVSQDGTDTAYLEREQYDTHLAALNLKKQLMEADKTVAPSKLEKINTAIKRGEVYRDNKIPYEMIADYQDIGVEEWRKMGDKEEDEYDPEMYQKLWEMDELMTKAGVSYRKGAPDKNKYYLKDSKSGSGSGSKKATIKSFSGDFGRIGNWQYAPQVKAYETIDAKSGSIPIVRTVRPNIVHKISASR